MNPNHTTPHYLGGGPNLNLLDNMLMAAGFQATDQPKHSLVPQYPTYSSHDVANMHMHQAMNLVQPQVPAVTASDPVHVIVYQNEGQQQQQQQPISYKIPQLGGLSQEQSQSSFVVNNEGSSSSARQQQYVPGRAVASMTAQQQTAAAKTKKDIVAQAMQEQKIFEDSLPKTEVKQEPGVAPQPVDSKAGVKAKADAKAAATSTKTTPVIKTTPTKASKAQQKLPNSYQQPHQLACRSKDAPNLSKFEDDDDGLTCRLCMASYWYKKEMHEHLKTVHSITDPDKYDREEREKRQRKQREEGPRSSGGAKRKIKEEREERRPASKRGRKPGTIKLTSPGARQSQSPGARPSFQYRDRKSVV